MYGYIYKTTNILNGKIYVGQHKSNKFNQDYIGSGVLLRREIIIIGKKHFKVELLEECGNREDLCDREVFWIEKLSATDSNIGYNISDSTLEKKRTESKYYCRNTKTYSNIKENKEIRLLEEEEIPEGYTGGRLPMTKEWCKKIARHGDRNGMYGVYRYGDDNPCYGKIWYYNPVDKDVIYINSTETPPDGYISGNPNNKKHLYCWVFKEEEIKTILKTELNTYISNGWQRGMKKKHEKKLLSKEEVKERLKEGAKRRKVVVCPYCGKEGKAPGIYKHHFDKCKHKGEYN